MSEVNEEVNVEEGPGIFPFYETDNEAHVAAMQYFDDDESD